MINATKLKFSNGNERDEICTDRLQFGTKECFLEVNDGRLVRERQSHKLSGHSKVKFHLGL